MAPERCLKTLANSFCRNSITKQMQSSMCWTSIQKSLETLRHVFLWSLLQLLLIYEAIHIPMEFDCCRFTGSKAGIPRTATPVGFSIFYERETAVVIFKLVCQGSNRPSNRCKMCEFSQLQQIYFHRSRNIFWGVDPHVQSPSVSVDAFGPWGDYRFHPVQHSSVLDSVNINVNAPKKKWAGENRPRFWGRLETGSQFRKMTFCKFWSLRCIQYFNLTLEFIRQICLAEPPE